MFNKKNNQQSAPQLNNQSANTGQPAEKQRVYTMPEQYMPTKSAATSSSGGKKWLIIGVIAFAVFIILVAAAVFLLQLQQNQQAAANTNATNSQVNQNANSNSNANGNTNSGSSLNFNVNESLRDDIDDDLFGNENGNTNSNSNANSNSNKNTATGVFIDRSNVDTARDKDRDGLTDEEEELYGTAFAKPDSDQDGFLDGNEVEDGYSPAAQDLTLVADGLTLEYENDEYGWTIEYPAPWLASSIDNSKTEVLFTSDAVDGELVEVIITENEEGVSAAEWFASLYTDIDADDLNDVAVDGLKGIVSPDGYQYHVADENYIISIIYNFGTKDEVHFEKTFQMMLNSFEYSGPRQSANTNTNGNSNANSNSIANTNNANSNSNANTNGNSNANANTNAN